MCAWPGRVSTGLARFALPQLVQAHRVLKVAQVSEHELLARTAMALGRVPGNSEQERKMAFGGCHDGFQNLEVIVARVRVI